MTAIVKRISFLGSTIAVLTLGTLLAAVSWRRCRAVATVVLIATFGRPLLEFTLKAIVDRDRPDLERLVNGQGPSFPSGHVMAAAALWGLVPLVVTLFTRNRRIWWATTIGSALLILAIAASRTYLGVHWLSDIVAGLIVGGFFLWGVECCSPISTGAVRAPLSTSNGTADPPRSGCGSPRPAPRVSTRESVRQVSGLRPERTDVRRPTRVVP